MKWNNALIEWESGGLEDVPTENIKEFISDLETELTMRGHGTECVTKVDDNYVVAVDGMWIEGSYTTEKLARYASTLPCEIVSEARDMAIKSDKGIIGTRCLKMICQSNGIEWDDRAQE